jgi:hypothetical protein
MTVVKMRMVVPFRVVPFRKAKKTTVPEIWLSLKSGERLIFMWPFSETNAAMRTIETQGIYIPNRQGGAVVDAFRSTDRADGEHSTSQNHCVEELACDCRASGAKCGLNLPGSSDRRAVGASLRNDQREPTTTSVVGPQGECGRVAQWAERVCEQHETVVRIHSPRRQPPKDRYR